MTLLGGFQHWAGLLKLQGTDWFFTSFYWRKCSKFYLKRKKKKRREGKEEKERDVDLTDVYLVESVSHTVTYRPHIGPGWRGQAVLRLAAKVSWWKCAVTGGGNSQVSRLSNACQAVQIPMSPCFQIPLQQWQTPLTTQSKKGTLLWSTLLSNPFWSLLLLISQLGKPCLPGPRLCLSWSPTRTLVSSQLPVTSHDVWGWFSCPYTGIQGCLWCPVVQRHGAEHLVYALGWDGSLFRIHLLDFHWL